MDKKQVISDALWVDVDGFTVLRNGRIFDNDYRGTGKVRELKQRLNQCGYLIFNKNNRTYLSHRIVVKAYISNPDNLPQVNHRDENKTNNIPTNLEYCTPGYNTNYGTRNKRVSEKMTNGKLSKKVYQYTADGEFVKEWPSGHEIERQLGYLRCNIGLCCCGKYRLAYGYRWSYIPLH